MTFDIDYNIRDIVYWVNYHNPFVARGVYKTTIEVVRINVTEYNESIGLYEYDVFYSVNINGTMVTVYPDELFNTPEEAEEKYRRFLDQAKKEMGIIWWLTES